MKTAILTLSILMLGMLTVPAASAVEEPFGRCNPTYGDEGLIVETSQCVAQWNGGAMGYACRTLNGEKNCEKPAENETEKTPSFGL